MVRKSLNESRARRAGQTDDADTLARAAGILRRLTPAGREKQFEDARVLLLAMAIKIRSEKRAATDKENA